MVRWTCEFVGGIVAGIGICLLVQGGWGIIFGAYIAPLRLVGLILAVALIAYGALLARSGQVRRLRTEGSDEARGAGR